VSCEPEQVTGYVDGALDPLTRAGVEEHLRGCDACRAQVEEERRLREALRRLPSVEPPRGLELNVRRGLRRPGRTLLRALLPVAAVLVLVLLWARGSAPFVARELALDHMKCFRKQPVPAKMWSSEGENVAAWFAGQGTQVPSLPDTAGGLELIGARYCPLLGVSSAAHVYYVGEDDRHVSLYVVPRSVRLDGSFQATAFGKTVHLSHYAGNTVGIVSETPEDVETFRTRLSSAVALNLTR
jgi:anti-sigma factor RsiW